jgi:hypothetical protein
MKENPDFFIGAFENGKLIGAVTANSDGQKGWINRLALIQSIGDVASPKL